MQMFPYSSLIERQVVYTTGGALLSKVENDWAVNAAHGGMSSDIFSVFNTSSDTYHYDLAKNVSLGAEATKQISKNSRTVAQANIDAYGNVTSETQVLEDKFITLTTITTSVYAPDDTPEGWWPNRMTSSTVARSITYKQGQVAGRDPGTQTDKTVTTHIAQWNEMYRKPQDVTVAPGASALTMDECNVDNLNACQSTVTSYNVHGLPTQVDVKGAKLNGSADTQTLETRTTTTNYTNDGTAVAVNGYFPRTIGQVVRVGSSLTQSITTNPRTGLPLSATDASGVTVTTAYDALARPISVSTTGFPTQYIGYMTPDTNEPESTNGIPVDPDTIMMVLRRQAGAPESAEYINRLGQTVRTRSKDFSGTNVFQDMRYDNLGRMTHESNVYRTDAERAYTQYTGFDVLNRPSSKVVQASESGESVTSAYAYDDFKTTVTVTPSAGDENGKTLTVKREVNSLGQLMEVHDANSTTEAPKTTQYAYDGAGNPIVIKDAANNSIFANYDDIGRKVWVKDPNQGQTHFVYNDFGELERETSGIGDNVEVMGDGPDGTENDETISYDHDRLGRVTARRGDNQTSATFRWDLNKDGLIAEEESGAIKKEYEYDSSARPTTVTTTIEGNSYAVTTAYDSEYGRPKSMTYPNNLTVALTYNAQGYLSQESNAQSNYVYRTITKQDAWGNITAATLTNETLSGTYAYSARTGQMTSSVVKLGTEAVHDLKYTNYDAYGNVITQTNDAVGASETFAYDTLHRLTKSTLTFNGSSAAIDYAYDAVGNLKKKSDYSADNNTAYSYKANTNQLQRVALKDGVTDVHFGYDIKGNLVSRGGAADDLTLENTYNAFNKPTRINRLGSTVNLSYGADLMRYKQVRTVNNETITTYYIDKVFEVELSGSGSDATREETTYLGDMAVLIELTKSDGTAIDNKIRFTHKDRLGSSATFTDHNGEVTTRRSYDPFGAPKGGDWAPLSSLGMAARLYNNGQDMDMPTRRGYTDHEHLDEVEIIHMNGRVYDYNVGRFLSVDPVIVDPTNTQAINPYSYVMNNPLSYTDPSGYATEVIEEKVRISQAGSRLKKTVGTKTTTTTTDDVTGKVTNVTTETVLKSGDVGVQSTNFDDNGAATSTTLIGGNLNSGTFGAVTIMSQESGAKSSPNLGHDSTADFRRDPCQQASCRTGIQNPSDNRTLTQIDEGLENLNSYVSTVAGGFGLASVLKSVVTKIGKEGVRLISKLRGKEGVSENLTNHGLTYDPRVRRRAVEDGIGHNFPYSFDDSILGTKGVNLPRGATGYLVRGFHNGKDVVFNIVVKENVITHRDFVNVKNWPQRNRSFSFNTELENIPRL
jgi:RHS repeat-associated protein